MFVLRKPNRSGSISVVVAKKCGKVHYLKTIGVSRFLEKPVGCRIVEVRRKKINFSMVYIKLFCIFAAQNLIHKRHELDNEN
jgi:hypothetical protein